MYMYTYPLIGQGVKYDPQQTLNNSYFPTAGRMSLLKKSGGANRKVFDRGFDYQIAPFDHQIHGEGGGPRRRPSSYPGPARRGGTQRRISTARASRPLSSEEGTS